MINRTDEAFLAAIAADPEDDNIRVVYADYLEETGRPERAEFIRVQVELARLNDNQRLAATPTHRCTVCDARWVLWPGDDWWSLCSELCGKCCDNEVMGEQIAPLDEKEIGLYRRERELLVNFPAGKYWLGQPDPFVETHPHRDIPQGRPAIWCFGYGVQSIELTFHRGFVEAVEADAADWVRYADAIYWFPADEGRGITAATQPVQRVALRGYPVLQWVQSFNAPTVYWLDADPAGQRFLDGDVESEAAKEGRSHSLPDLFTTEEAWGFWIEWMTRAMLRLRYPGIEFHILDAQN